MDTLKLGTRGSQLALFQAHSVATLLQGRDVRCEIVVITTSADRFADAALSEIGGKRLFVKEIEDALLRGDIDLAVHSSKDLPADLPEGLRLGAVPPPRRPAGRRRLAGRGRRVVGLRPGETGGQRGHRDE